jgi:hypothetical protein
VNPDTTRRNVWIAAVVAGGLYLLFQVLPPLAHQHPGGFQNDFKHIYLGSWLLVHGGNPYDAATLLEYRALFEAEDPRFGYGILPFVYPPFAGLVTSPLTVLSFPRAVIAWQLLNHLLLVGGLLLAARAAGWRWTWQSVALLAAATVWNFALFRQNTAGQMNMVLVAGYGAVAFGLVRGWRPAAVGLLAGTLALYKLSPGILLVYFVATRRWRHAAWMAGWGVGLLLLSILVAGWRLHLDFLPLVREMGYGQSTWWQYGQTFWRDAYNQSPNAFWHRALVPWEGAQPLVAAGPGWANGLTWLGTLGLLGAAGWAWGRGAARGKRALSPAAEAAGLSVAILLSLLAPSLMWDHYLVQALVPAVLLWPYVSGRTRGLIAACVGISCLGIEFGALRLHFAMLGQPLLLLSGDWRDGLLGVLFGGVQLPRGGLVGAMLGSIKLWPTLVLFGLACRETARAGNQPSSCPPT